MPGQSRRGSCVLIRDLDNAITDFALLLLQAILDPPQGAEVVSIQPKKTKEILGFLRLQQRNLCGERQDEIQLKNFPFNYDRLSLRDSQLKPSSFFVNMPKPALKRIKVLDVGRATFVEDSDVAWPKLRGLRELYLEGVVRGHSATFLENVLKQSKNLEVLDLERARLDQGDLVTIAKRLPELRELYLGYTNVWDSDLRELERSGSRFDKLRNVCMTQTSVSHIGVSSLLNQCPSLQKVSVRSKFVGYGPARDLENSRHGFRVYREENNHALAFFSDRGCGHFRSKHGNRASDL